MTGNLKCFPQCLIGGWSYALLNIEFLIAKALLKRHLYNVGPAYFVFEICASVVNANCRLLFSAGVHEPHACGSAVCAGAAVSVYLSSFLHVLEPDCA